METQLEVKLRNILGHFDELEHKLAEAGTDYQLVAELSKERAETGTCCNWLASTSCPNAVGRNQNPAQQR
jgi:hypothetical protein